MTNDKGNYLGELGLLLLLIVLVIVCSPLLLGILIAVLLGATGILYFTIVLGIAIIIWMIILGYIYI